MSDTKLIHFTGDWEADREIAPTMFRCQRCGEVCFSTDECLDHRSGWFITRCERARLLDKIASLLS